MIDVRTYLPYCLLLPPAIDDDGGADGAGVIHIQYT